MKFEELYLKSGRVRNEIRYLVMRTRKSRELQKRRLALQRIKSLTKSLIKIKRALRLKIKIKRLIKRVKNDREKRQRYSPIFNQEESAFLG
jgi:hypothetical protein